MRTRGGLAESRMLVTVAAGGWWALIAFLSPFFCQTSVEKISTQQTPPKDVLSAWDLVTRRKPGPFCIQRAHRHVEMTTYAPLNAVTRAVCRMRE